MKKILKLLLLALLVVALYETYAVLTARSKTPEIFNTLLKSEKIKLRLTDLSKEQITDLLTIEDPNFYTHNGFDFQTAGAGVTSITQAMVKYLYFDHFEAGFKKIEQTLIAWLAVTPLVSKDEQLTVFINTAYMGKVKEEQIRGFADASQAYYDKEFSTLTHDEYLSLVALLLAPNTFHILKHKERNDERVERIKKVLNHEYQPTGLSDMLFGQVIN